LAGDSAIAPVTFLEVKDNALHPVFQKIENARSIIGNVNNSTSHEWATIINAHH
jgi:hypothetical protein